MLRRYAAAAMPRFAAAASAAFRCCRRVRHAMLLLD